MDRTWPTGDIDKQLMKGNKETESIAKILPLLTALIPFATALIGLLVKALPDPGMPGISRISSKFENLKKLESHLGRGEEAAVHMQRKILAGDAREALCHNVYVRQGMDRKEIRQRLVFGCFSASLVGFELGVAIVLGYLCWIHSQKDNDVVSLKLSLAFIAILLMIGLTVAAGDWIYAHITLNRQFRFDMRDYSRKTEDATDASLQETMDRSFVSLIDYERRRFKWKFVCLAAWFAIASDLTAYSFILNGLIPKDLLGLDKAGALDGLSTTAVIVYLIAFLAFVIAGIAVLCISPKDKSKRAKATGRHDRDEDPDMGNGALPTVGRAGRSSQATTAGTPPVGEDRPDSRSPHIHTWGINIGVYHG